MFCRPSQVCLRPSMCWRARACGWVSLSIDLRWKPQVKRGPKTAVWVVGHMFVTWEAKILRRQAGVMATNTRSLVCIPLREYSSPQGSNIRTCSSFGLSENISEGVCSLCTETCGVSWSVCLEERSKPRYPQPDLNHQLHGWACPLPQQSPAILHKIRNCFTWPNTAQGF